MTMTTTATMTMTMYSPFLLFSTVLLFSTTYSEGFQLPATARHLSSSTRSGIATATTPQTTTRTTTTTTTTTTTQLQNLFGNLFGQQSKQEGGDGAVGAGAGAGAASNPIVNVFEIPAKVIKIKPLKFYLQLFLVGEQNTPVKGAWLLNANEDVEEYLEVYYADGSGVILVEFDDLYGLRIKRKGTRPSLQYMLQESVLLHSLLDELEAIAFGEEDGEVEEEKRLLQFADENKDILSKAREGLPARPEPTK